MVVDVGVVKNHIKPKADSTLYNMRKTDLIEYVRTLEHNYNVAVSFNENQARYIESLGIRYTESLGITKVVRCKDCVYWKERTVNEKGFVICSASGMEIHTEDFCSYGERGEGE